MSRKVEEDHSKLLNTIFIGEVASVQNYGAFVKIPGSRSQGLIHRSQVSKVPVDDVTEVLQQGEQVWCKVINITDENKIGLSMKVVDQGTGTDLDPNGVLLYQDEQRRKQYVPGSRKKVIQLEAVFNTTCTKCGTKGHLAKDCFKSPDGKTYELIPEDDDDLQSVPQSTLTEKSQIKEKQTKKQKKSKKKKHKKEKEHKSKKKKKRKPSTSTSTSSSSEDSDESSRQHRYSHKAGKKRKHSSSPRPGHSKKSKSDS